MTKVLMTYDLAMATAKDAADRHAKANNRKSWHLDDYNLACRILARLYPTCGANNKAGLATGKPELEN